MAVPARGRFWRLTCRARGGGHSVRFQRRAIENTVGRKCLCNGLMANNGLARVRLGIGRRSCGAGFFFVACSAADVVNRLTGA
jgi:hypothetical protein